MFRAILYSQWKWSRLIVVLGTVAGFALPIMSLQGAARADRGPLQAQELLRAVQSWGGLYPVLAAALGLLVAIATWAPDHRGRHVHALSLPLPRWRYVLLRFGSGVTLLVGPILAVLVGALLATTLASIPVGLQGYPLALALRFAMAVLVAYAVFFAVSAGRGRGPPARFGVVGARLVVQIVARGGHVGVGLRGKLPGVIPDTPGSLAGF